MHTAEGGGIIAILNKAWHALINVAIVIAHFDGGGTERQITELIRRLNPARFSVRVACFHRRGVWLPYAERAAREVVEFPLRSFKSPASLGALLRFASWLRARQVAIVHTCDVYSNVFGLAGAALAGVRVRIASRRGQGPAFERRSHLTAQRLAYRAAHRVVANSHAAAAWLLNDGVAASKRVLISNGIDLAAFEPRPPRERRRVVTTIASLRWEKGQDILLRAAAAVRRRVPDAVFRIVGEGALRERLLQDVDDLGLGDAVEFLGYREDIPALLASSDLFAFPSRTEAFPNALMEAMAAGLPVVASAVGGIPELVENGSNGLLVPPDDHQALAEALLRLMEERQLATRLGRAARDTIERRYSFERMVSEYEDLYLTEIGAHV